MTTPRILIVYATHYGQTGKVARFVADLLIERGHDVTLLNASELPGNTALPHNQTPRSFDGVIIGGSVVFGRHQRSVARFARTYRDVLNAMPTAFLSVSGSTASQIDPTHEQAHEAVDAFVRDTGWHPGRIELVGGAMAFTRYNPLMRFMMKRISAREGGPTDTSHDYEFTDWQQLARFADAFITSLPHVPARPELHPQLPTSRPEATQPLVTG